VTIPPLPTLTVNTNAAPSGGPMAAGPGIRFPMPGATNLPAGTSKDGSTLVAQLNATNRPPTNNLPPVLAAGGMITNVSRPTNAFSASNVLAQTKGLASTNAGAMPTNAMAAGAHKKKSHSGHPFMMGMGFPGMGGPGKPLPELPPVVKARIDAIVNSELLGPVPHPLPKALLGIAGDTAFLRADSGETGLVKVGDNLGDLKLLRIGINRVLIEQNGEKQELTIFDGMGGDSLLNTSDKNSNETIHH
jgi:hypothetical protein